MDKKIREIVGVYIGERSEKGEARIVEFSTTSRARLVLFVLRIFGHPIGTFCQMLGTKL